MTYNLTSIRQLVTAAFSDDELKAFCFDRFPAVYQDLTVGQTQGQRVLLLVDFAARQGQLDTLLNAVQKANPYHFDRFAADVRSAYRLEALSDDSWPEPGIKPLPFEPETILIPAGPFLMDIDDPAAPVWKRPQHTVGLPAHRIGKFPVTNTQYAVVHPPREDAGRCPTYLGNVQEWTASLWGTQPGPACSRIFSMCPTAARPSSMRGRSAGPGSDGSRGGLYRSAVRRPAG